MAWLIAAMFVPDATMQSCLMTRYDWTHHLLCTLHYFHRIVFVWPQGYEFRQAIRQTATYALYSFRNTATYMHCTASGISPAVV